MDCRLCYFCGTPFRPRRVDQFLCATSCYDKLLRLNQSADNFKIQYGATVGSTCTECHRSDLPLQLILKPRAAHLWDDSYEEPWAVIILPLSWCIALCKDCRVGYQLHNCRYDF